jgi:hypothetical protein
MARYRTDLRPPRRLLDVKLMQVEIRLRELRVREDIPPKVNYSILLI